MEEIHNIEITYKNKLLPLFHMNACSLNKNFDDLQHLLSYTKFSKSLNNCQFLIHVTDDHCQFLIHGSAFPHISTTMKPQVLQKVTSQNFL